jgi:hypothetical protein
VDDEVVPSLLKNPLVGRLICLYYFPPRYNILYSSIPAMSSATSQCSTVIIDDDVKSIHNEAEMGSFDPYLVQFDESDPANPHVGLHRKCYQY